MKPSKPYHAFTAYHREPAGLRRLDFFVERILAWQGKRTPSRIRILDIGCGNGNLSLPLASLGFDVTGVDLDPTSIGHAKTAAEDVSLTVRFVEGSVEQVTGETFDVIVASEVLEHLRDPHAFLQSLRERCRPDGLLLLSVPNGLSLEERIRRFTTHTQVGRTLKRWMKRRMASETVQSSLSHPHEQFFSFDALLTTLRTSGWRTRHAMCASAWFKEFFYLFGRFFMRRGSSAFHACDAWDAALATHLPLPASDGWLLESFPSDPARPLAVHVLPTLSSGGAERLVLELAKRLPKRGVDVHVVSIMGGGALEPSFDRANVRLSVFDRRGPFGMGGFFPLRRLLSLERPEIVHTHLFGADLWGRLAAFSVRTPVVLMTEHNVHPDEWWIKRIARSVLTRGKSSVIAISEDVKKDLHARGGISSAKIRLIRNGIDLDAVIPRGTRPFPDVPHLVIVGRLDPQKGHAVLLKALALVKRPWTLEVIGTGKLERDLRALADRLGIAPRIHWSGFCVDIPQRLSRTDIFCFPSIWEGMGLALAEAAAAGVPIVASDLPAFRELLSAEHVTLVPAGDVPALAHALRMILSDPTIAIQQAQRAVAIVRERCSIETMVDATAALYRERLRTL